MRYSENKICLNYGVGISVGKISKIYQNRQKSEKTKNFNLQLNQYIIEFWGGWEAQKVQASNP